MPAAGVARSLSVPGVLDLKPVPATGRARAVVAIGKAGDVSFTAGQVRRALKLRSTWIRFGVLSLSRAGGTVASGSTVTLFGRVELLKGVTLEQRAPGGTWQAGAALTVQPDNTISVDVTPAATTEYRLAAGTAKGAPLRVVVGS
jgi:hypothetical protein